MTAPVRLPSPGPSFIREETIRLPGGSERLGSEIRLGLSAPSVMDDGWWLCTLWATDQEGVATASSFLGGATPPAEAPVAALGRTLAGALSGLLDQEAGRQLIRVRMPPAADESKPWQRPLLLWLAVRWDPVRSSVMRPNELARELLRAFARAVQSVAPPT